jgi:hypothetical protein
MPEPRKEDLTPGEFASLREVAIGGLMQKRIPQEHRDRLIRLRLIEQVSGGLKATPSGALLARS